jgi:hypothetical protein
MKFLLLLLLLVLLNVTTPVFAELPEKFKDDFSPLNGVIIMPVGEEYLVDLDAAAGLDVGDILSIIVPGEKIIHPATKKILGTLSNVNGFLQVTRVMSGYSYAQKLSGDINPQKGAILKRYEKVPARFQTEEPNHTLSTDLMVGLPHLHWLDNNDTTVAELTFTLTANSLIVSNSAGAQLKSYPYKDGALISLNVSRAQLNNNFLLSGVPRKKTSILNQTVGGLLNSVGLGKKDKRLENPGITSNQEQNYDNWMGQNLNGNPVGIAVGDFDNDGLMETAVAMEDHLQIHRISDGKLSLVDTIDFNSVHLLSLDTADLDKNGTPELYLSGNVGVNLSSQAVEFKQGKYQRTITRVPWFLRVIDLPQEGPTLIAQTMRARENPFYGVPFRVTTEGKKLIRGADFSVPTQANLFSITLLSGTDNNQLYAFVNAADKLFVTTPQETPLWESEVPYGGSEVFFYNAEDSQNELAQPVYIQQQAIQLPSGEILVAQNDGNRTLQRLRNFKKSRVVAMKWDGFTLHESWRTSEQAGYLADFTLADADNDGQEELVMVIKYSQKNLLQKGRSTIVIYELDL